MHDNPRQGLQLAYLAGLMDGEGTIRIDKVKSKKALKIMNKRSPNYSAHLSLGSVDEIIPKMFHVQFGGSLRVECVSGKRPMFRWYIRGNRNALQALKMLLPYLVIKKRNALEVIRFIEEWKTPYSMKAGVDFQELQRREEAYQKLRKLNAVGLAATTEWRNTREGEATV